MNTVISAFKTKKNSSNIAGNEKLNGGISSTLHHGGMATSGSSSKKKAINAQDSGYQYLRHIREIDTTRILPPVVVAADEMLETELLNFRPPCMDVVDHAVKVRLTPTLDMASSIANDCNMNGLGTAGAAAAENGNCNDGAANGQTAVSPTQQLLDADDDESEHSTAACTSSSSEQSNSTVVNSPTVVAKTAQQQPSPAKSLNLSLSSNSSTASSSSSSNSTSTSSSSSTSSSAAICNSGPSSLSSSTSCDVTTLAVSPSNSTASLVVTNNGTASPNTTNAHACSTPSSPTATVSANGGPNSDYVPAFLKSAPITLPIIMPNGSSGLASVPPNQLCSGNGTPANSAANTPKHMRYTKPRLSLSRLITHSMPSVHGRPNLSVPGTGSAAGNGVNGGTNGNPPKRISTHQRNLSLDFRSMGILLPPVSQVTNTRINLTQHHRNRSLDSALQRIPEVEVSSPNAESENTFCTPSILGTTMCSKIVTTAANVTAALTTTTTPALTAAVSPTSGLGLAAFNAPENDSMVSTTEPTASASTSMPPPPHAACKPSVIVEPCAASVAIRARPKSSESTATPNVNVAASCNSNCSSSNSSNNSKKREDLTSLGSDDSGIICGSESDQISLNRIRHSHESLDSGEMDAEEECIDMLETTSMDEEYGMLQSDLCFYQTAEPDCRTLRPARKKHTQHSNTQQPNSSTNNTQTAEEVVNERKRYRDMNMSQAAIRKERTLCNGVPELSSEHSEALTPTTSASPLEAASPPTPTSTPTPTPTTAATPLAVTPTPSIGSVSGKAQKNSELTMESTKNEVLFKNFFGATKNAIFRTAQSIIENHEKKNAAKNKSDDSTTPQDQIKSPTDISKKKEFFGLISSNSSKKAAAAAAAAAAASAASTPAPTPTTESCAELKFPTEPEKCAVTEVAEKPISLHLPIATVSASSSASGLISKSSSISSLNKLKVPGVVKCFIKERPIHSEALQKTEKGPSGLLRFFESPVFNIHFAIHYLFYSKEPGVLSFIGNKIFSFPDQEVDLYIPQLIVMYIQMDELAEVLDPYLTIRCRKSVDFSLKCLWLLEAYNYQVDSLGNSARKSQLALMKEIFSKKERKILSKIDAKDAVTTGLVPGPVAAISPMTKKTHHRSQSDATVLLSDSGRYPAAGALSISNRLYQQPPYTTQTLPTTPAKLCLGDLTSGRAFDNGCTCFETVRGQMNGLLGQKTVCSCGAPKTAPQKEFMKALINVGKNLTSLPSKAEKTSALRMFLNLINKNLPARVWLPLYSDIPHHVVRITEEKTAVLNSKDKTPYIIYVECVEVSDIYSSPLIPKMMPSLRHTKSEEHLEGACGKLDATCSRTSSCSSHSTANSGSCRRRKDQLHSESSNSLASDAQAVQASPSATVAAGNGLDTLSLPLSGLHVHEDDVWSQEDDEITAQYLNLRKLSERDAISQMSLDSCDSRDQGFPVLFNIGDVRTRHCNNLNCENTKSFSNDPEDPSAAALKEPWHEKEQQIRESSPYGHLSNWRLLSAIVKCGDDLRQELMATQLLQMFKIIWQEENVDLWVRPYKIVCLSNDSGLIEPILNTVSLHQIKKNSNKSLRDYFIDEYGAADTERFRLAQKNFVQSCAAYCLISYLLQVKDRHNGNILLHSDGHIIHIDFGFILSISPKNLGFEQSPFKLTPEFVDVMGGTASEHWKEFNRLLLVGMMSARKHMDRIINFVEIMRSNAQLPCFKSGCSGTVQNLRKRFHMNLTEQEMERKVEQLVQDSLKSLSTKLYDGYQYYTNGIL